MDNGFIPNPQQQPQDNMAQLMQLLMSPSTPPQLRAHLIAMLSGNQSGMDGQGFRGQMETLPVPQQGSLGGIQTEWAECVHRLGLLVHSQPPLGCLAEKVEEDFSTISLGIRGM